MHQNRDKFVGEKVAVRFLIKSGHYNLTQWDLNYAYEIQNKTTDAQI